jgi:hypothetical protein
LESSAIVTVPVVVSKKQPAGAKGLCGDFSTGEFPASLADFLTLRDTRGAYFYYH